MVGYVITPMRIGINPKFPKWENEVEEIIENNYCNMEDEKEIAKATLPELVKGGMQLVSQFYKDLAQPTVQSIGKTLNATFEFAALPALALGFATEKVKLNFAKHIEEYKKKIDRIPEEDKCIVEPEIGVPIISNLMNTTNDQIADLFTTLLTNASNIKTSNKVHPKFSQIVQYLTPDEAKIIQYLKGKDFICYVDFKGEEEKGSYTLLSHATLIPNEVELSFPENINAYISNLISLGILLDKVGIYKINNIVVYGKIVKIHKSTLERKWVPSVCRKITTSKGHLEITDFGKLFIDACIS